MTNDNQFRISRRKVLGGLGTIGVASAGAGLGTTAFFSDTESVSGWLQAGRVDLLLDYRTTYMPWLDLSVEGERERVIGEMMTRNAVPLPDDDMTYVIGQAPDVRDTDGDVLSRQAWGDLFRDPAFNARVCEDGFQGSDLPEGVRLPTNDEPSLGTTDFVDGDEEVFVDLIDVKPKDEGETTFSLHLCGNPSYLDMRPILTESLENTRYEPETSAGDVSPSVGELAEYLHVSLWYDVDCDNFKDGGEDACADVAIILDRSGSMNNDTENDATSDKWTAAKDGVSALASELEASGGDIQFSLISYNSIATRDTNLGQSAADVDTALGSLSTSGNTDIADAIQVAQEELTGSSIDTDASPEIDPSLNDRDDCDKIIVLLTNGNSNNGDDPVTAANTAKAEGIEFYTIAYGDDADQNNILGDIASSPDNEFTGGADGDFDDIIEIFNEIGQAIVGEICLYEGSFQGLIDLADENSGTIPLSALTLEENCVLPDARECFDAGVYCYGLKWQLPCEVEEFEALTSCRVETDGGFGSLADEIAARRGIDVEDIDVNVTQTDSIHFSVAFDAEQCRHNTADETTFVTLDTDDATPRQFGTVAENSQLGSGAWQSAGPDKEVLYLGPNPNFVDFPTLPAFTIDDIEEISYYTKKDVDGSSSSPTPVDFYLLIYTEPQGGSTDDASWYNKRLNAEPYYANLAGEPVNAPANQWNKWTTAGIGPNSANRLRFVDANRSGIGFGYADGTMPTLADLQNGPIDWSALRTGGEVGSIDYGSQTVKSLAISTGSGWNSGFDGLLDNIVVKLTSGDTLVVDLEV